MEKKDLLSSQLSALLRIYPSLQSAPELLSMQDATTLHYLYRLLGEREPASLRTCVLVRKERESLDVPIDFLGFVIPDVWVVGYGLDFADTHRTLPYIAELNEHVYQE